MPAHYRAWVEILRPHGIDFPEDRFYSMGGMPTGKIVELLFAEAGKVPDVDGLTRQKEAAFMEKVGEIRPIDKVVEIARKARGHSPMAVASGGHRHMVEMTLRQIGILDWFPVIVAAEGATFGTTEINVGLLGASAHLARATIEAIAYQVRDVFDVTPAGLIDAIVTEKGVVLNPTAESMRALLG